MSGRMSENHFTVANVPYGPHFPVIQNAYVKEIVNWTGLNLCSYMQVSPKVYGKRQNFDGAVRRISRFEKARAALRKIFEWLLCRWLVVM
jgi:hypothetical protein